MKISFWIPAVVLYMVRGAFSNSVHVGTVLFTTTDLVKKCWTENDKSLLKARLIMQDVLPDPDCIDFSNEEAVAILLDYFHSCYEIISRSTYGKLQNLMYLALSDAVGGYLRAFVLPFTRRAYYAGQVKYEEAKKLFQLYDDIRVFLKTNGVGWAEPRKFTFKKFHVKPLVITGGALEACKELYVIEKQGKLHCFNSNFEEPEKESKPEGGFPFSLGSAEHLKQKRRRFAETKKQLKQLSFYSFINSCSGGGGEKFFRNWNRTRGLSEGRRVRQCKQDNGIIGEENVKRVIVPLPILDDCVTPHSIAVPFVNKPFRNLKTGCSAFILEYYYLAVVKCFIAKGNSRTDIKKFNGEFYSWLESQVLPHLNEEQWYPGFGGVLRVLQTIKKFGLETGASDPVLHDIAFMFKEGAEFEVEESFKEKGKNKVRDVAVTGNDGEFPNSQRHVITAIIIVSMIWLFIFCTFAFYCQATRGHKLLYEGHDHSSRQGSFKRDDNSSSRGRPDNYLNFQFLVKFFKKNNEVQNRDSDNVCLRLQRHGETMCIPDALEPCHSQYDRRYTTPPFSGCRQTRRHRHGRDHFCFTTLLPGQPFLTSLSKAQTFDDRSGGDAKYLGKDEGDQIKMLWKKPSIFFRDISSKEIDKPKKYDTTVSGTGSEDLRGRTTTNYCSSCLGEKRLFQQTTNSSSALETKCYTSGKQTSTCNCSDYCPFAYTTTTSSTQLAGKISSATMDFFEEIIAKHNAKKNSTQDSTAESETECCTSSETDY